MRFETSLLLKLLQVYNRSEYGKQHDWNYNSLQFVYGQPLLFNKSALASPKSLTNCKSREIRKR